MTSTDSESTKVVDRSADPTPAIKPPSKQAPHAGIQTKAQRRALFSNIFAIV
jgi:hypothetical protein